MGTPRAEEAAKPSITRFQRLNNVIKRVILGTVMISGFLIIIYLGPIMLMLLVLAIQMLCFQEVLRIGYNSNKVPSSLPYFRSLCWYFLFAANYFFCGETVALHFQEFYKKSNFLSLLISYHRFISFCIYFVGIILFVLSLKRKYDSRQFRILAWTHTLLIIIVLQSYLIMENMFTGLIWLIVPASLVILNDIFAFVCGRIWGRTPLIELSPKKTWEGFIGGAIGTFISGFILSNSLSKYKYFVCPVEYYYNVDNSFRFDADCTLSYLFQPTTYSFWFLSIDYYPFFWHFFNTTLFASIIAPFGGFCASGFKRAFKVKDFGDVIPGHGGIMDRFDCEFLMATFTNVYIFTFVQTSSVDLIFDKILYMDEASQVRFYYMLRDSLETGKLLNLTVNHI